MIDFEILLMLLPFIFAIGVGGPAPAPTPAPSSTEDGSLNQYFLLLSNPWRPISDGFEKYMRRREEQMCPGAFFSRTEFLIKTTMERFFPGRQVMAWQKRRAKVEMLNPFGAEFFGAALCRRLGIGTSEVSVMPYGQAKNMADVFIKSCVATTAGRELRLIGEPVQDGELVLVSQRIAGALPVSHLPTYGIYVNRGESFAELSDNLAQLQEAYNKMRKVSPVPASFYSDFDPEDRCAIGKNSNWESDAFRRIFLARIFLGTTAAHNGNVLVDGRGNLYCIDFGTARRESGEDLEMFFTHIQPTIKMFGREMLSEVWLLMGQIAALTDLDLRRCVDCVPYRYEFDLLDYYRRRLSVWKRKYEEGLTRAAGCIADLPPIARRAFYV